MSKLYPPFINGTIPAFTANTDGTANIVVPFSMNRGVSLGEVNGFVLKIKTVLSNKTILVLKQPVSGPNDSTFIHNEINFSLAVEQVKKLTLGEFYKIQLAYYNNINNSSNTPSEIKDSEISTGYFSSVGIIKYTSQPKLKIDGYGLGLTNSLKTNNLGVYTQDEDYTEKLYLSGFQLFDSEGNLIEESGDILHNADEDSSKNESITSYIIRHGLRKNITYLLNYYTESINGVKSSIQYRVIDKGSVPIEIDCILTAELNYDNAYISVKIESKDKSELISGTFKVFRSESMSNFAVWDEIYDLSLSGESPNRKLFKDFAIEQGVTYRYCIQQYNSAGLYSERLYSNDIYADFEDAFLFDGERQLKIKYNPKIATFKQDLLENKQDTIGSKYPFIFRNGQVGYKEFSISGMISFLMDEEKLFLSEDEIKMKLSYQYETNLDSLNIAKEREFKLNVMDWLSNGKEKVFKSPSEGNYLVRLLNTSLTPVDTLGRMLHNFTGTAYEIGKSDIKTLMDLGLIEKKIEDSKIKHWATTNFADVEPILVEIKPGKYEKRYYLNKFPIEKLDIREAIPGTIFYYIDYEGKTRSIIIGATGCYKANFEENPINSLYTTTFTPQGFVVYQYEGVKSSVFNTYNELLVEEVPVRQFIGIQEEDLVEDLQDIKKTVNAYYDITLEKRAEHPVYVKVENEESGIDINKDTVFYSSGNCLPNEAITADDLDSFYIYNICASYYNVEDEAQNSYVTSTNKFIDGYKYKISGDLINSVYEEENLLNPRRNIVLINNKEVDLFEIRLYSLKNFDLKSLIMNQFGVALTMTYQLIEVKYNFEIDDASADTLNGVADIDPAMLEELTSLRKEYWKARTEYLGTFCGFTSIDGRELKLPNDYLNIDEDNWEQKYKYIIALLGTQTLADPDYLLLNYGVENSTDSNLIINDDTAFKLTSAIETYSKNIDIAYDKYIKQLEKVMAEYERVNAIK